MGYQERALRRDSRAAAWFLRFAFRQVCPGVGKLKDGEQVPITLVVEDRDGKRESIEVMAPVKPLTARAPSRRSLNAPGARVKKVASTVFTRGANAVADAER